MKTYADLLNEGYVHLIKGYLLSKDLSEEDQLKEKESIRKSYNTHIDNIGCMYSTETLEYKSKDGIYLGLFKKLNDKFDDCSFVFEKDKSTIELLCGRVDVNNENIYLGDTVETIYGIGRVIWLDSQFYIFNDENNENEDNLSVDKKITKLNLK